MNINKNAKYGFNIKDTINDYIATLIKYKKLEEATDIINNILNDSQLIEHNADIIMDEYSHFITNKQDVITNLIDCLNETHNFLFTVKIYNELHE